MHITFICGSFQPGRDGVGDYTRRLAEECVRQGHSCSVIALNDPHQSVPIRATFAEIIPTLRLPSSLPWGDRTGIAREFREEMRPDWISVQFVPYSFHPKGFVHGLERRLKSICGDHRMHVMFHELWVGGYAESSWKERLIGAVQRGGILGMVRGLNPALATTSNASYAWLLEDIAPDTELLPLFGNIPVAEEPDWAWIESECRAAGVPLDGETRQATWIFAMFGTFHEIWPEEPLFSKILEAAEGMNKKVVVATIGRLGAGETHWEDLCGRYPGRIQFLNLGEQCPKRISAFLRAADFGIASMPWQLIEKSGTTTSMIEHGLPVIVNRDDIHFGQLEHVETRHGLIKMDSRLSENLASLTRREPMERLAATAQGFLALLTKFSKNHHEN